MQIHIVVEIVDVFLLKSERIVLVMFHGRASKFFKQRDQTDQQLP